jgi:hypothetical protein
MVEKHRAASKKRVQELILMARKLGLKHLKVGEIEFELNPISAVSASVDKKKKPAETVSDSMPTDDELLFASAEPYASFQSTK